MKKTLTLAGIEFIKVGKGKKKEKFYDPQNNNLIVFRPFDGLNSNDILNQTMDDPWGFIAEILNECENVVVQMSAIEQTTADFAIYYDIENVQELAKKKYKEVTKTLDIVFDAAKSKSHKHWKYVEVAEGEIHPVHFNQQGYIAEMATIEYNSGNLEANENGYVVVYINGNLNDNSDENVQWVKVC